MMDIDRVTLIDPGSGVHLSFADVVVRSVTPSKQSLVFEAPYDAFNELSPDRPASSEAGYSLVLTTAGGRTYDGYVEVVANGADTRFYWCGVGF